MHSKKKTTPKHNDCALENFKNVKSAVEYDSWLMNKWYVYNK